MSTVSDVRAVRRETRSNPGASCKRCGWKGEVEEVRSGLADVDRWEWICRGCGAPNETSGPLPIRLLGRIG